MTADLQTITHYFILVAFSQWWLKNLNRVSVLVTDWTASDDALLKVSIIVSFLIHCFLFTNILVLGYREQAIEASDDADRDPDDKQYVADRSCFFKDWLYVFQLQIVEIDAKDEECVFVLASVDL